MNPHWEKIERIFHAALERPAAEREAFVRGEADEAALADEVLGLLRAEDGESVPAQPLQLHGLMEALGSALLGGRRIGPYTTGELLGEGGMGLVFRARDERDGSTVAIKVLAPDQARHASRVERFLREGRALAAVRHPAIVAIREAGSEQGVHYLAMECLEGETLHERVRRAGALTAAECIEYGLAISGALEAAHAAGVTHRDLKPDNVMLTAAGVKVLDFGLAHLDDRESEQRTTLEGALAGTVAYLSPEQIEGSPGTPQSDLFALGVLLHEAATGQPLFQRANPIATARAILQDGPDYRRVPAGLRPVLQRCLAKNPRRRYGSAAEVTRGLQDAARGVPNGGRWGWMGAAVAASVACAWLLWMPAHGMKGNRAAQSAVATGDAAARFELGRYHWNRHTTASLLKAADCFREAAAMDPKLGPAWAYLADTLAILPEYGVTDAKKVEEGRRAAMRALEMDGKLAMAHGALAWIRFSHDWNWGGAEAEFRKAIQLAPNEALPHQRFGKGLIALRRFDEAEGELRLARKLNPLATLPMINLAELWFYAHRYDREEEQLREVLELDPTYVVARAMLTQLKVLTGQTKDAIAEAEHLIATPEGGPWCTLLAEAYARDGQADAARRQIEACGGRWPASAITYVYLGEVERALDMTERQYADHDPQMAYLDVDPNYAALKGQPRFDRLLRAQKLGAR